MWINCSSQGELSPTREASCRGKTQVKDPLATFCVCHRNEASARVPFGYLIVGVDLGTAVRPISFSVFYLKDMRFVYSSIKYNKTHFF